MAAVIGPDEVLAALRPFPLSRAAPMPYYPTAIDKVRFVGEPVAVVVASDRYSAEDAAELVDVDYEPLPAVVRDPGRAMETGRAAAARRGRAATSPPTAPFAFGAGRRRVRERRHVVEGEYDFPRYSSTPMECYSVIARLDGTAAAAARSPRWSNFHGPFTMVPVDGRRARRARRRRCG